MSRKQLLALGFTGREIDRSLAASRLIRIHQGVYAVGHSALSDRGRMVAALLAAGDGAVLSHRTAAYLYGLTASMPPFADVTTSGRRPRHRPGLVIHQTRQIATTRHRGLPVTTPGRTIADLPPGLRDRARAEALVQKLIPRSADDHAEPTRSEFEDRLLAALDAAQLPRPLVNHVVLGHEADFVWPDHGLVVETDGWAAHGHRRAFEADRARDAARQAAGFAVLRFTWRQVMEETLLVTVRIAQLLNRSERDPHRSDLTASTPVP